MCCIGNYWKIFAAGRQPANQPEAAAAALRDIKTNMAAYEAGRKGFLFTHAYITCIETLFFINNVCELLDLWHQHKQIHFVEIEAEMAALGYHLHTRWEILTF